MHCFGKSYILTLIAKKIAGIEQIKTTPPPNNIDKIVITIEHAKKNFSGLVVSICCCCSSNCTSCR